MDIIQKIIEFIKRLIQLILGEQSENNINLEEFYKKDYLLTQNELKFYKILKQITDKMELTLFCQVPMYELINCKDHKSFNRIRSKSIDFVITEKTVKLNVVLN